MTPQVPTSSEPGIATLVKGIVDDIGDLIDESRDQLQARQVELAAQLLQRDARRQPGDGGNPAGEPRT